MRKKPGALVPKNDLFGGLMDDVKGDVPEGIRLRDEAIAQALRHAETVNEGWSRTAFKYLIDYIRVNFKFTVEEIRIAAEGVVPVAPDSRAWGGIVIQAARAGFIKKIGVKNGILKQCHHAPKTVWQVSDFFFEKAETSEQANGKAKTKFTLKEMIDFGKFLLKSKNAQSMHKYIFDVYGIDIDQKEKVKDDK